MTNTYACGLCQSHNSNFSFFFLGKTDKFETCSTSEDIIELQDVRMSPIPSLRKGNYNSTVGAIGTETLDFAKFPPSFRIARNYGTHRSNLRYRGQRGMQ